MRFSNALIFLNATTMVSEALTKRGIFVVFEGVDRSGKSTQCRLLVESLKKNQREAELRRCPERSTAIGQVIDQYLTKKINLDDRAVHLLFSANRWEMQQDIRDTLMKGIDVVCDRYAYSGVAFSAAKPSLARDIDWCKAPDAGLPEPDVIIYLVLSQDQAQSREGFGGERYEETEMQQRVAKNFQQFITQRWHIVDAARSIDAVQNNILDIVTNKLHDLPPDISSLAW